MLANLPCAECQAFHIEYDWTTHTGSGKRKMAGKPDAPNYRPVVRPPTTKPPCQVVEGPGCPKGSPAEEKDCNLTERNRRALEFYRRVRAMGAAVGRAMSDEAAQDGAVQRNFAIIDPIVQAAERRDLARAIAGQLPVMVMGGGGGCSSASKDK